VSGGLASFKFHSGSAICGYRITDSWALNVELKDLDEDKAVDLIALQKTTATPQERERLHHQEFHQVPGRFGIGEGGIGGDA